MISRIAFVSLSVTDLDRAIGFWRAVMGFAVTVDSEAMPGMRWVMLKAGDAETELHLDPVDALPPRDKPALPLTVADLDATVETLRSRGAAVVMEPKPAEWDPSTRYALIRDSEGNVIYLGQPGETG
ncbi:MAG: VOC family protein [Pseudomonadota bacterium]